jgi:hypothetical protein
VLLIYLAELAPETKLGIKEKKKYFIQILLQYQHKNEYIVLLVTLLNSAKSYIRSRPRQSFSESSAFLLDTVVGVSN